MKARRNRAVARVPSISPACAGISRSPIATLPRRSILTFSVCLSLACGTSIQSGARPHELQAPGSQETVPEPLPGERGSLELATEEGASSPPAAIWEETVSSVAELISVLEAASQQDGGVTIELAPGDYHLSPSPYLDPTCGNCEDPQQPIPATLGLRISGERIVIRGANSDSVCIYTHAGYGLLFEDCHACRLEAITVTGGERDTAGQATDAAIVARRSSLTIAHCRIADNIGDSATIAKTIVGIMGICGREDADITVSDCEILRNSWDGIALYRDARARIENSVIDGIDGGASGSACGGRGVGIGITWNAQAEVEGNLVKRYWKGIGIFVNAEAQVRGNVVEDMLTWGISLWDAGCGTPYGEIAYNAIHRTGACGISVTRGQEGGRSGSRIVHNALVRTGTNPKYDADDYYCFQRALANHARTPDIEIADNIRFENREPEDCPGTRDLAPEAFQAQVAPLVKRLAKGSATHGSDFCREFSLKQSGAVLRRHPCGPLRIPCDVACDLGKAGITFASDAAYIYSSPLRLTKRTTLWIGGLAALGGLIYAYDQEIYDALKRNQDHALYSPFRKTGEAISSVGHMSMTNRYYFGGLALSYVLGFDAGTSLCAEILEAHFITGIGKNLGRLLVGRHRPHEGLGPRSFEPGDGTSFPSGHAINILELATILVDRINPLPLQIACYGLAAAVCFERVTSDQHWPSDVYVGAVYGAVVSQALLDRHKVGNLRIHPTVSGRAKHIGLAFTYAP